MSDYPVGIYRTQTCNETISNYGGGYGSVRVFDVFLSVLTTGANAFVKLYNSQTVATNTNYIVVRCQREFENSFSSAEGVLFPNGCHITTGGAIDFATIICRAEP